MGENRNRIVWLGRTIPLELREVAPVLGLSVEAVQDLSLINAQAADLFAVIVSAVGPEEAKALGRVLHLSGAMHLIDYGVLLAVASTDATTSFKIQGEVRAKTNFHVFACEISQPDLAGVLRAHEAGPAADPQLVAPLPGHDQDYELTDYERDSILIQRAFNGFARLTLKSQGGGFSQDCKVWRIDAYSDRGPCQPFVAKAARRDDLEAEFETYCAFVRDSIPFPFRAPLLEGRFVKGSTRAVLVSAFVGRSQRLDEYLTKATNPELVMVSLFDGALGTWRRNAEKVRLSLGHFYVQLQQQLAGISQTNLMAKSLLPDPEGLTPTFKKATKNSKNLLSPVQIWEKLDSLPVADHFVCRIHGDLNIRNVFVRWNSIDTILIDFSHSGLKESLARDPAKLETSISLTCRNVKNQLLPEKVLRQLYGRRLLPPRHIENIDGRTEAIRQIRQHAGGEGVTTEEYELLVVCHLLRFACEPLIKSRDSKKMQSRRILSYKLACSLLNHL